MASNNNEKGSLPTITIIDSDKPSSNELKELRSCCICFPERTGVVIIFSFYFLSGFLTSITSFFELSYFPDTVDKVLLVISGVLYASLSVSGGLGLTLIRKDDAVMMRKLSMASWIITGLIFTYSLAVYILEIVSKQFFIQQCQDDVNQDANNGIIDNVDCNQVFNIILVKDASKFIFVECFSLYFSYIISRFSRRMLEDSKKPILPYGADQSGQMTPLYAVYVTRPPTTLDWIPPPTYTVRTNNVPSNTNNAPVLA